MYKLAIILSVCAVAVCYTDMDDSLNVDVLSKDKATVQQYLDCFLDRSPCTPTIAAYKKHLLEAISDGCKECNDTERHMLKVFIQTIKGVNKLDYNLIRAKYDPNNHMETTFADIKRF